LLNEGGASRAAAKDTGVDVMSSVLPSLWQQRMRRARGLAVVSSGLSLMGWAQAHPGHGEESAPWSLLHFLADHSLGLGLVLIVVLALGIRRLHTARANRQAVLPTARPTATGGPAPADRSSHRRT
jgi:hypothetical protein